MEFKTRMEFVIMILFIFIVILLLIALEIRFKQMHSPQIQNFDKFRFGSYVNMLEKSKIKIELDETQLIKLTVIVDGIHIKDFIVNKNRTLTLIPENKTIKLSKHDFKNLERVESTLQNKGITGCPDDKFGTFWLITIHEKEPINIFGSICLDESGIVASLFRNFCNSISEFY